MFVTTLFTLHCWSVLADHGLARLVEAYRAHGHKAAKINPLMPDVPLMERVPEIDLINYNLPDTMITAGKSTEDCACS